MVHKIFVVEIGGVAVLSMPTFCKLGPPSEENDSPLHSEFDRLSCHKSSLLYALSVSLQVPTCSIARPRGVSHLCTSDWSQVVQF